MDVFPVGVSRKTKSTSKARSSCQSCFALIAAGLRLIATTRDWDTPSLMARSVWLNPRTLRSKGFTSKLDVHKHLADILDLILRRYARRLVSRSCGGPADGREQDTGLSCFLS